jgi:hypothetical protein
MATMKEAIEMTFHDLFQQFDSQIVLMPKRSKAVSPPVSVAVDWNVSMDCLENCTELRIRSDDNECSYG